MYWWDNLTDFVLIADLQQTDRQLHTLREGGRDLLPQLLRQAILILSMPFSAQRSFTLTSLFLRISALSTLILYSHLFMLSTVILSKLSSVRQKLRAKGCWLRYHCQHWVQLDCLPPDDRQNETCISRNPCISPSPSLYHIFENRDLFLHCDRQTIVWD